MVDAVRAVRSPGSALKPFIYGMAIDDGLIQPDTLIDDRVLRIGDYAPRNFDRLLHGEVTAAEALQQSYNLPAIALLARVGPSRFAATLRQAGIALHLPRGHTTPSLPLALGGVGIRLEDLAALYVGLADRGRVGPLRLRADDPIDPGVPIMTADAARAVTAMLRGTPAPDGMAQLRQRAIAYKTGTSYGFRDAWALGSSGDYTIGVWVGRAEGTHRPGAYGRDTAAPIMVRLFDLLPPEPVPPGAPPAPGGRMAPRLRHFSSTAAAGPHITFPPGGARLEFDASAPLALEASGGTPPYTWMVNGLPLPAVAVGLTRAWVPDGAGFAHISVVDGAGRTTSETVRLVGP
jgi:penicillin-binding protein 1C